MQVSLGLAFLAGLASFLSPCVFALVPAYIGYLSGRSLAINSGDENLLRNRWGTFTHGLAFVLGFSIVFILLGVTVSYLGGLLHDIRGLLTKVGGVIVIIFGLHMMGILRIPFLEYDLHPRSLLDQNRSYFSSLLMGVFFSAGWSPCVGPILGSILTFAFNDGSIAEGVQYLAVYSAGLAIPFLLAAISIGWFSGVMRRFRRVTQYVEIGMGAVMTIVGVMLFLGIFQLLAGYGFFVDFGL